MRQKVVGFAMRIVPLNLPSAGAASSSQWEEIVRSQLADTQRPRPFFSDRLQEMHGGTRDQRGTNEAVVARKQAELAFLGRLRELLA